MSTTKEKLKSRTIKQNNKIIKVKKRKEMKEKQQKLKKKKKTDYNGNISFAR